MIRSFIRDPDPKDNRFYKIFDLEIESYKFKPAVFNFLKIKFYKEEEVEDLKMNHKYLVEQLNSEL